MNGWTEDDATDVRTRDLAERQRRIMDGAAPWGVPRLLTRVEREQAQQYLSQAHPRRIDWLRVAIIVSLGIAAILTVLGIGAILVYVLTAF